MGLNIFEIFLLNDKIPFQNNYFHDINNKYTIMCMEIKHNMYDIMKSIIVRRINSLYINIIHGLRAFFILWS